MALPAFRQAELEYLVSFSDAKAIAIAPEHRGFDHAALARELKSRLPVLKSIFSTRPLRAASQLKGHTIRHAS